MGTFIKTFLVDGEEYELYAQLDNGTTTYDLLDALGTVIVVAGLLEVPDDEEVVCLVRAADGWGDEAV